MQFALLSRAPLLSHGDGISGLSTDLNSSIAPMGISLRPKERKKAFFLTFKKNYVVIKCRFLNGKKQKKNRWL